MFQFPLLVCDIGGTNARFGLIHFANGPLEIIARLGTANFAGLAEAIAEALKGRDIKADQCPLADERAGDCQSGRSLAWAAAQ